MPGNWRRIASEGAVEWCWMQFTEYARETKTLLIDLTLGFRSDPDGNGEKELQLFRFFKNEIHALESRTRRTATRFDPVTMRISLAVCAKSPKAYEYLSRLLELPASRTIRSVFKACDHAPGLNPHVFAHVVDELKRNQWDTVASPRTGCMVFDEVRSRAIMIRNLSCV
jgi:hypothetical protein